MRLIFATLIAFILTACASVPGSQTLGLANDPDQAVKSVLVGAGLVTDAVGIYGQLPPCDPKVKQPLGCRKEKAYRDVKLILSSTVEGFAAVKSGSISSLVMIAALGYAQYEIAKTIAAEGGPTNPDSAPTPQSVAYLQAIGAADVLVSSFDQRIQDAASPNVTVAELQAELRAKVAALP